MTRTNYAFLCFVAVGLCVQGYFLLKTVPSINLRYKYGSRQVSQIRVMVSNISRLEGRHHSSENRNANFPNTSTVLETSKAFVVDVDETSTQEFYNNSLNRKLSLTNVTITSQNMPPQKSPEGRCYYKVQVYDNNGKLSKHKPVLQSVVKQSAGGAVVRTNITCDSHCNIELTLADDKNKFAGMDAVVFHMMKLLIPKPHPPENMNPNQAWVYFSWESPRSNGGEHGMSVNKLPVHATWTYHRDSEIVTPYGYYRPGVPMTNQTKSPEEWVTGKTKLIAWIASNCVGTFWPRSAFVKELKKLIPVDTYGACGSLKCTPSWSTKCTVDLMRKYKFYLSLENAECGDYITEKFWGKPLMYGVVPIVYGPNRKVYEELSPPNSFIYVGDYKNMRELADYLKLLDSKPELYAQYLEWQYKGSIGLPKPMHESYDPSIFCNLIPVIEKVKRGELKRRPVRDSLFAKSCKSSNKRRKVASAYGVGKWDPW